MRITVGHAYSLSITSTVVVVGREAEQLLHAAVVGQPTAVQRLDDVVGDRGTEQPADPPGDRPVGADERDRDAAGRDASPGAR